MTETIRLPARCEDLELASKLNQGLRAGTLRADWSQVTEASSAFLRTVVAGLELDRDADALGADTMSDALAARLVAAFEGALEDEGADDMAESLAAREAIVRALEADLIGPFQESGEETLPLPPSRWYLTGFLAPEDARDTGDAEDEEEETTLDDAPEASASDGKEAKQRRRFPASIGMSVILPAGTGTGDAVQARVRYGKYQREEVADGTTATGRPKKKGIWHREGVESAWTTVALDAPGLTTRGVPVEGAEGLWLVGQVEPVEAPGLPEGARALALFVVNRLPPEERGKRDQAFVFQVELALRYEGGLVARPDRRGEGSGEVDDAIADVQFRDKAEYAVGHGVAVDAPTTRQDSVTEVRTCWLPRYEVQRVKPRAAPEGSTVAMEELAELQAAEVEERLGPIAEAYGAWIGTQAARTDGLESQERQDTRDQLMAQARRAQKRVESGIARLASDADLLQAFRWTNRVMAQAARKRMPQLYEDGRVPQWRLFQLAFLLLNVDALADPEHPDREEVELIFFPTGGGKTEAYLGVIAMTLLLRRMRGQARADGGLGVAVILRYTLRLLTLDQLGRAATLICGLELLRREQPERLGAQRFAVGLWVGLSATANTLGALKGQVLDFRKSSSKNPESPFPLPECPWCGTAVGKKSFVLRPDIKKVESVHVGCLGRDCEFSFRRSPLGLPVLFVDEQIYAELPAFIVGTVDKFAMLPWRGETGKLFGRVRGKNETRTPTEDGGEEVATQFVGAADGKAKGALLPDGLLPPELIVQDELHLISGPLGTMVGLYETAIDFLCEQSVGEGGARRRPKILASTATVRRASEQIRALFARDQVNVFPPPGIDDGESFFAERDTTSPGRLYVGVAASARSMKAVLARTYTTALTAAQKQYLQRGAAADPYMTLAGYFNSLRVLGGMRRLVEDDVRGRSGRAHEKVPEGLQHIHVAAREIQAEPVELTSRETTGRIKEAKDRLNRSHSHPKHVDVVLASNMISVGVDIDRLGLMVVAGQPKATAEYIQASSRVGRRYPGLVLTCFNVSKPRDRSHYERFAAYHASFYRFVEATSLTPFSTRAIERGLVGTLFAMTRLGEEALTPAIGARFIEAHRDAAERAIEVITDRVRKHTRTLDTDGEERLVAALRKRASKLIDIWVKLVHGNAERCYSQFEKGKGLGRPLLTMPLEKIEHGEVHLERELVAPTSMRDVEPEVHLWVERANRIEGMDA